MSATNGNGTTDGNAAEEKHEEVKTHPLLISNKPVVTKTTFPVHSPATGKLLHHFSSASIADTDAAIAAAQKAYPAWKVLPPAKKRDIFLKAADILDSKSAQMTKHVVEETGGTEAWAGFNISLGIELLRDVAGRIATMNGMIPQTSDANVSALVYKEPYGVILAIAPWNAPYILGMRSFAYPLAAGNTVILKAPEFSPMCYTLLVSALHDAGLPSGCLSLIAHQPADAASITKHLIQSPVIKKINFTGSTGVGRIIAELAGKKLKPVLLELGGKAPAIVCEDADLENAAMQCTIGAFLHAGQICMSTERIIVHEKVMIEFEGHFKKAMQDFAAHNPDGPILINSAGVTKNQKLIKDALSKGATVLHGDPESGSGAKMTPVAIKGTTKDMDMFYTESFGPTVSVVTVKSDEEAIEVANDTEYGLSAAIFTKDLAKALRMARQIESGAVHINKMTVHDEPGLPHGGTKASGYGRFGATGLEEWVRTKTVTFMT